MSDRLGFVYTTPPAQLNRAIYRCKVIGRTDTFDSMAANCEGQTVDRLLFYALI